MSTYRPRASYYSRGRGRPYQTARPTPSSLSSDLPPDRDILDGLASKPLQMIARPVTDGRRKPIEVRDLRYVGSYNWIESPTPSIIVPGSPNEWRDRPLPYQVALDSGIVFRDQNGYRMPSTPLLPLITAVNKKCDHENQPSFDWSTVDFVTDRNNLRKLVRWVDGATEKDFRIDAQLVGTRTVLLNRWEPRSREVAGGSFGFSFEKASTKPAPGCEKSTGHHRIISYDLDGLKMVVRFEVDGYIPSTSKSSQTTTTTKAPLRKVDVDDLASALASVSLSPDVHASTQASTKLTVKEGGSWDIPQHSILELTTRSKRNYETFNWIEAYPQLFLSQTANHFAAIHERGNFSWIYKEQLTSDKLKQVNTSMQTQFKKLASVLNVIKELVIKHGQRGRLSFVSQAGSLMVYERTSQDSCLPDEALEYFES